MNLNWNAILNCFISQPVKKFYPLVVDYMFLCSVKTNRSILSLCSSVMLPVSSSINEIVFPKSQDVVLYPYSLSVMAVIRCWALESGMGGLKMKHFNFQIFKALGDFQTVVPGSLVRRKKIRTMALQSKMWFLMHGYRNKRNLYLDEQQKL